MPHPSQHERGGRNWPACSKPIFMHLGICIKSVTWSLQIAMLLQVAARFEFAASTGESYRRHGRYLIYCFIANPFSLRQKKQLAAKKIRFAASCSNPYRGSSKFFGRGIRLSRGMLHVKFHPNPSNNIWDIAICNKISSKMLHFAATKWSVHAPKFPKWERRSKYTIMPSFIFSARSEAYLFFGK